METQTSSTVLLCRPAGFAFNEEAAASNAFARSAGTDAAKAAHREFEELANALSATGVTCLVLDDDPARPCPDAIFPNNWVSFHADGTMVLYPMATESRRRERQPNAVKALMAAHGLEISRVVDLSLLERAGLHLEGTGSLILDRPAKRAFASLSERTHEAAVRAFDAALEYGTILFDAADDKGRAVYHTNVLLSLGTSFAVICGEAIAGGDRQRVIDALRNGGREVIDVGFGQMARFACNIIELRSAAGDPLIAMSRTAHDAFTPSQRRQLESSGRPVIADIPTIEQVGGGSVRCMIADVHLPQF